METVNLTDILTAPVLPDLTDAPSFEDVSPFHQDTHKRINEATTDNPLDLPVWTVEQHDRSGKLIGTHRVYYSTGQTADTLDSVYADGLGKMAYGGNPTWADRMLYALSLVKGGTVAYYPLPLRRDSKGFPVVDQRALTVFKAALGRLGVAHKAARNRFADDRFKVLPAADGATAIFPDGEEHPAGGFIRIVFTGTRVK